jgi:hypothetical protein
MRERPADLDAVQTAAFVPAAAERVSELFWDIRAWHAIWTKIDEVEVVHDDGVHQEFVMGVERDGRREDVRTIRYRRGMREIEFFSPTPPPTMDVHRGTWGLRPHWTRPDACWVTACREYRLIRGEDEDAVAYARRRREYRERFAARLAAILGCFVEHYAGQAEREEVAA